jgi:hypothetical protein
MIFVSFRTYFLIISFLKLINHIGDLIDSHCYILINYSSIIVNSVDYSFESVNHNFKNTFFL